MKKDCNKKTSKVKRDFRTLVFSRHPTHNVLRNSLERLPFRTLVRLGSTTELSEKAKSRGSYIECNSIDGINNTSNKLIMKLKFICNNIPTPTMYLPYMHYLGINHEDKMEIDKTKQREYVVVATGMREDGKSILGDVIHINELSFPIVAKINFHSRGRGMQLIKTLDELKTFLKQEDLRKYTFEKYTNFVREYRVHATKNGIFYICRKLRKTDAEERWFFNSKNSIFQITFEDGNWITEQLPCFEKMQKACISALDALKMDIAGFDVRINMSGEEFLIIEANSACSFGEHTAQHYIKQITNVLKEKHNNNV